MKYYSIWPDIVSRSNGWLLICDGNEIYLPQKEWDYNKELWGKHTYFGHPTISNTKSLFHNPFDQPCQWKMLILVDGILFWQREKAWLKPRHTHYQRLNAFSSFPPQHQQEFWYRSGVVGEIRISAILRAFENGRRFEFDPSVSEGGPLSSHTVVGQRHSVLSQKYPQISR